MQLMLTILCQRHFGNKPCQYADDTCILLYQLLTSTPERLNYTIQSWSRVNNLTLNLKKLSKLYSLTVMRSYVQVPSPLTGIQHVSSSKISGITINSQLSVGEHISSVMSSGTQTACAPVILRAHGTRRETLRLDFRPVVIAKLLYAASAWWHITI